MKNLVKVAIRRVNSPDSPLCQQGIVNYRLEKITGAVTVEYPLPTNINQMKTGRVGDTLDEKEATSLIDRYEVTTLANT